MQYYSGSWKTFGVIDSNGLASLSIPAGTYSFRVTYGGASLDKSQNIGTNPLVVYQTIQVSLTLQSSTGATLSGGAQYYATSWNTFGSGTTPATMELLSGTYTFRASYGGATQDQSQNVATNPVVTFHTVLVTMKLLSSTGAVLSGGAQYYATSWGTFGTGVTSCTMELLPKSYTFRFSYGGATKDVVQDVSVNTLVTQSTVVVHSDSGKAVKYYASSWQNFVNDMQMLPATYTFRFSDGTSDTQITVTQTKPFHIH